MFDKFLFVVVTAMLLTSPVVASQFGPDRVGNGDAVVQSNNKKFTYTASCNFTKSDGTTGTASCRGSISASTESAARQKAQAELYAEIIRSGGKTTTAYGFSISVSTD